MSEQPFTEEQEARLKAKLRFPDVGHIGGGPRAFTTVRVADLRSALTAFREAAELARASLPHSKGDR